MSNKLKEPNKNCSKCNRLKKFRNENRKKYPSWFNAPVPSIINNNAELLIVGLAPGISGANRTGRPFTGDHAGLILFGTLKKFGFSDGLYKEDGFDSLKLENCSITNAVRCVPPKNLPNTSEIKNCESFLQKTIIAHKNLKLIIALGLISHKSIISSFGFKQKDFKFGHKNKHKINQRINLIDSYHCSRYNTNTKRLTQDRFDEIFIETKAELKN
jgi:uracil-DNA glycosylase family 4